MREDYSPRSTAWEYFPHEQARSRAYRWGDDGLLGITDRECRLCFALALWNGKDPILKERLFGLSGTEGNHGEDVKECYFYLDSTPTHSYLKALYKYPQAEFPYQRLLEENRRRTRNESEFELVDTGVFDQSRYFDVMSEYAKADPDDILIRITIANRGPEAANLHLLPTLWYRNTWAWGCKHEGCGNPPMIRLTDGVLRGDHEDFGTHYFVAGPGPDGKQPQFLFTDNETNTRKLFGVPGQGPFVKDAFHDYVIDGSAGAVNPGQKGTKAAVQYRLEIPPQGEVKLRFRLANHALSVAISPGEEHDRLFDQRILEADEFFGEQLPRGLAREQTKVARQAYAGLLWSK